MRAGPHLQPLLPTHINQALESSTGLQGREEVESMTHAQALISPNFAESVKSHLMLAAWQ